MAFIIVVGPLETNEAAQETARALGKANHSVFSRAIKDANGFDTEEREWFVERDTSVLPQYIMGYSWGELNAKQMKRGSTRG